MLFPSSIRVNLVYLNTEGTNFFWGFYFERLWSDLHSHASPTFMTSPCALTWAVVGKRICQNRNHRLGVAAMFTSMRTEPRVEPLDAASLRQQRRLKQALQFLHRDSADLLPLDGLKKLGTAKQGVCCRPGGDPLTFIQTVLDSCDDKWKLLKGSFHVFVCNYVLQKLKKIKLEYKYREN